MHSPQKTFPRCHSLAISLSRIALVQLMLLPSSQCAAAVANNANTGDSTVESLQAAWSKQLNEISSAKIDYRLLRRKPNKNVRLASDDVLSLCNKLALDRNDLSLSAFAKAIDPSLSNTESPYTDNTLVVDGDDTSVVTRFGDLLTKRAVFGNTDVRSRYGEAQVDIMLRGQSRIAIDKLSMFRVIPSEHYWSQLTVADISNAEDGRVIITNKRSKLIVNPKSLCVEHCEKYDENGKHLTSISWMSNFHDLRSIAFPRIGCRAEFNEVGILTFAEVFIITQMEFNEPISREEFSVPAKAGNVIADYRAGTPPTIYTVGKSVDNALDAELYDEASSRPEGHAADSPAVRPWLLYFNIGVVAIMIACIIHVRLSKLIR